MVETTESKRRVLGFRPLRWAALVAVGALAATGIGRAAAQDDGATERARSGIVDYQIVSRGVTVAANQVRVPITVECPSGTRVFGGGVHRPSTVAVESEYPYEYAPGAESPSGWYVEVTESSGADGNIVVHAVCAQVVS
jgi:anti-sigma factor RsiW